MKPLKGRVAVVTGAASGIGRATALALLGKGCDVALVDVNEAGLAETAALAGDFGRKLTCHRVDVSDKEQMQGLASDVVQSHGKVHILINNAGVSVAGTFEHQRIEDFEWLFGINFWGVIFGCKYFLPHLRRVDEAHIVNISSVFGFIGVPMNSSYCASKFAVRGFTETLRAELTGSPIGVTSVHPGGVATNIVQSSRFGEEPGIPGLRERTIRQFQRMLPPAKAAERIVAGIERNRPRVLIAREAYAIDAAMRLMPTWSNALVGRVWQWERKRGNRNG